MPTEAENAAALKQFNDFIARTGGAAYPYNFTGPGGETSQGASGMTLRDYFAAQAMAGMLANGGGPQALWINDKPGNLARFSYERADAMLVERAK